MEKTLKIFLLLSISIIALFLSGNINTTHAQTSDRIVYDYVFLIDTSISMNDGTPSLFSQVKEVATAFVEKLPNGSNLTIITFDTNITQLGHWESLTNTSRQAVIHEINNLEANGYYTALWDAVCAGVDEMARMKDSEDTHIQLMISYTDGKDNASKNPSNTCIGRYQLMQENDYTYWIYNAIGGIDIPSELLALGDALGINRSQVPSPIRVAQFQPLTLNLGNLLTSDESTQQGCTVFWLSDESIEGKEISFSEQPTFDRDLPSGTAPQICSSGTSCNRKVSVSTDRLCFDFELINLDENKLADRDYGEYEVTLPLTIINDDELGPVYLMPQKLGFKFELIKKEEPTPIPSDTPVPTATKTAVPTNTPVPTSIPIQPLASIRCQGKPEIDLGKLSVNEDDTISATQSCDISFENGPISDPIIVSIESNNIDLLPYLSLKANDQKGMSVAIDHTSKQLIVQLHIPSNAVDSFKGGKHQFEGNLVFASSSVGLLGDFKQGQNTIPLTVSFEKPKSKLPIYIAGGLLILLIVSRILKKVVENSKPPVFKLVMNWTSSINSGSRTMMDIKPKKTEKGKYAISVGSSPQSLSQVAGFPDQAFNIVRYKVENKIEYYIYPNTPIILNYMETNEPFKLVSKEPFSIGDITINFLIG